MIKKMICIAAVSYTHLINGKDCDEWFRQQRKEFYERIGIDIEQTEQRRGMKM